MKRPLPIVLLLTSVVALSACTSAGAQAPAGSAAAGATQSGLTASDAVGDIAPNAAAQALLPAKIKESGTLKIGGETQLPPYLYTEGDKIVGLEADFMVALGKVLGLKPVVENTKFAAMVTGLTSNRIDVAMSDFSDTVERQKQVTFVDYTKAGQQLVVQKGNPKAIRSLADLCGTATGGPTGSLSVKVAQEQSEKCVAEGKAAVDVKQFPSGSDASLALQNKRIDSLAFDAALATQLTREKPDAVEVAGDLFALGYHGAAVRKTDTELQKALQAAMDSLMSDGTYTKIINKWGVEKMAMGSTEINAAK